MTSAAGKKIGGPRRESIVVAPAQVPFTEEPRKGRSSRTTSLIGSGSDIDDAARLRGLSSLAVANAIRVNVDKRWWRCDCDAHYNVMDAETESLIFRAVEDVRWWCCCDGNLQSILIRDHGKNLVARVSYKERSLCSKKLVMAIYAPVDLLVGTVEESDNFFGPTEFVIRNADGKSMFSVFYDNGLCSRLCGCCCPILMCSCGSKFKVVSADTQYEVGRILDKTSESLRLQFKTKLDITGKIVLTGFCIGLIHKAYNQEFELKQEL